MKKKLIEKLTNKDSVIFGLQMLLTALIVRCLSLYVIGLSYTPTDSMAPTIRPPSLTLSYRLAYLNSEPEDGDIVIFTRDEAYSDGKILVKRVIGTEGDRIKEVNGTIYRNGEPLEENYLKETPKNESFDEITVPDGTVFVLGDNRNDSYDSRYWAEQFVPVENIIAKEVFTINFPWVQKEEKC